MRVAARTAGLLTNELVNRKVLAASTLNTSSTNLPTQISTLDGTVLNNKRANSTVTLSVVFQVHLEEALE